MLSHILLVSIGPKHSDKSMVYDQNPNMQMFGSIDCHAVKSGYLDARISPFLLFRKQHKPNQSPEPGPPRIPIQTVFYRIIGICIKVLHGEMNLAFGVMSI